MSESRLIVLTGVSRGLGEALVGEFDKAGHVVVGCARSAETVKQLAKRVDSRHRFDVVDVTDCGAMLQWAKSVQESHGVPELLINNAAVINDLANLWETDPTEFDRVIKTNINGVFYSIRAFVPGMVEKRRGIIVNLSSGWGRSVSPQVAPYCGTKWGVEGMTKALAEELPKGMAAIPLNPGIINTDMLRTCFGSDAAAYPDARSWAKSAAPFILKLTPRNNGQSLTVGS